MTRRAAIPFMVAMLFCLAGTAHALLVEMEFDLTKAKKMNTTFLQTCGYRLDWKTAKLKDRLQVQLVLTDAADRKGKEHTATSVFAEGTLMIRRKGQFVANISLNGKIDGNKRIIEFTLGKEELKDSVFEFVVYPLSAKEQRNYHRRRSLQKDDPELEPAMPLQGSVCKVKLGPLWTLATSYKGNAKVGKEKKGSM